MLLTVCYYNLVHSNATEKFRSVHKFLCPTFYFTRTLIDFMLFGRNSSAVTAKQVDRAVPIFDLLFYEKYIRHKHLSTFLQGLVPFFHQTDNGKCVFRERKAVRSRDKYAVYCGKHRFGITITNICVALKQIVRLATSIR